MSNLVGVRGLEPPASGTRIPRATNCATPRYEMMHKKSVAFNPVLSKFASYANFPNALYSLKYVNNT